ncbi:uncharacterized protein LOC143464854 [Clavelina lepadiformis]|uniref:Uncharacterized protein n=1 Tax=Clavelina lepadiformis TaxID=159417 RepID=A0ABP0G3D2_CLALP
MSAAGEEELNYEDNVRKKMQPNEESNHPETSNENKKSKPQLQKSLQAIDRIYDGIRGHERHILFHFFALFSISFFVGVVFIHLSLWVNAHFLNIGHISTNNFPQDTDRHNADVGQPHEDVEQTLPWTLFKTGVQYTGVYFDNMRDIVNKTVLVTQ